MSLAQTIRQSLERSFDLYDELAAMLGAERLGSRLGTLPSNTIGAQLWCVVGARESYAKAIRAGAWSGFSCSLNAAGDPEAVRAALSRSRAAALDALAGIEAFTGAQNRLLCDLLEHEAAHHGQLIRYLYGLAIPVPPGWKKRYALE